MIIEDLGDTCLVEHVQYGQWQVTHHHHQPQVALNEVAVILEAPAQAPVETTPDLNGPDFDVEPSTITYAMRVAEAEKIAPLRPLLRT